MGLLLIALGRSPSERPTARRFREHGAVYMPNFLQADLFEEIRRESRGWRSKLKLEKDSIANGRLGRVLDSRSRAHQAFYADALFRERLQSLLGLDPPFEPSDFPIELRHYPQGAGMQWHQDDLLYTQPQCEFVFTLENTSDSYTEWLDGRQQLASIWTEPNSLIAIRAGERGPRHRVTPIGRGERSILKFVYSTGGDKTPDFYA